MTNDRRNDTMAASHVFRDSTNDERQTAAPNRKPPKPNENDGFLWSFFEEEPYVSTILDEDERGTPVEESGRKASD